jgi:hypothetical protein
MSGKDRLFYERHRQQLSPRRVPQLNFGLIAMLMLAALAMAMAVMFPDLRPTDLFSGP